jgi:hypothetical protein
MPSQGSLEEGYWTSRNLPWSAGAADLRGRQLGGGGGGRAGGGQGSSSGGGRRSAATPPAPQRSDWRLPRINGPIHRPVSDRIKTKGSSGAVYRPRQSMQGSATALGDCGTPTPPLAVHDPEVEATSLEKGQEPVGSVQGDKTLSESPAAPEGICPSVRPSFIHEVPSVQISL